MTHLKTIECAYLVCHIIHYDCSIKPYQIIAIFMLKSFLLRWVRARIDNMPRPSPSHIIPSQTDFSNYHATHVHTSHHYLMYTPHITTSCTHLTSPPHVHTSHHHLVYAPHITTSCTHLTSPPHVHTSHHYLMYTPHITTSCAHLTSPPHLHTSHHYLMYTPHITTSCAHLTSPPHVHTSHHHLMYTPT